MPTVRTDSLKTTIYDQEYFSGSQVSLYIGDVLIDEVTGLQVEVQQRKMPIYGYASQLFDKVAKSTVIVNGQFSINFKESGYLTTVLERYKALAANCIIPTLSPFISVSSVVDKQESNAGGARSLGASGFIKRQNIEQSIRSVEAITSGQIGGKKVTKEEELEFFQSLSGFNNESQRAGRVPGSLNPAEDLFERFEDKVWGPNALVEDQEGRRGDSNKFDNFTVYITFGDFNRNDVVNHTVKRIDGIHLLGQQTMVNVNGEPIQETYTFLARNYV